MSNKAFSKISILYCLVQGSFWINYCTISGYSSVYLLYRGLSNTEIGLIIGIAGLLAALIQPIVGSYADKKESISLKWIVAAIVAVGVIAALILCASTPWGGLIAGLLFGATMFILQLLLPSVNALGTEMINQGYSINYGMARGSGSLAYAAACSIMGAVVTAMSPSCVPVGILITLSLLLMGNLIFPFKKDINKQSAEKPVSGNKTSALSFFRSYPRMAIVLVGVTLVYISHELLNLFLFQIIQAKGGGSAEMSNVMSLCAIVELPTMLFFALFLKKAGSDFWFRISGIFLAVKAAGSLVAANVGSFYAVQVLQMFGWALISVSGVYYVNEAVEAADTIKAQAYLAMTLTLGIVIASFAGGWMLDVGGVAALLWVAVITAVLGMIVLWVFTERLQKKHGVTTKV